MQILRLELENTKSYGHAQIDFTTGTNAIVGHNGAGKSTILEAIGFVLFDSIGYRQNDFVREGDKSATITVTIVSGFDERTYQITRRCGASSQYYVFDPELDVRICEGKADVLSFLKEHMAVDPAADLSTLFSDAVGVPQGTLTAAFLQSPAQRKGIFDTLLQVDEYKVASERLREVQRTLEGRMQELTLQVKELETRLERLPELEAAAAQRAQQIATLQTELTETATQLETLQIRRRGLDAVHQQISALQQTEQQLSHRQQNLDGQLTTARQSLAEAVAAQRIVQENLADYTVYVQAQARQGALNARREQRQALDDERRAVEGALAMQRAARERLQQHMEAIAAAAQTVQDLAEPVAKQTELEQKLAAAQQHRARLEDAERSLRQHQEQLQRLEERRLTLEARLSEAETLQADHAAAAAALSTHREAISRLQQQLAVYRPQVDTLREQNQALEAVETAVCPVCEQPLTPDHRADMLARNSTRLEALRKEYQQTKQALAEQEQEERHMQAELEKIEAALRAAPRAEELTNLRAEIEQNAAELQRRQEQVLSLQEATAQIEPLQEALAQLGDPRQQRAVAQEMTKQRPQVEKELASADEAICAHEAKLDAYAAQRQQFADLDDALAVTAAELTRCEPAYQAVLTHRKLADAQEARQAAVDALLAEQTQVAAEKQDVQAKLIACEQDFDAAEYQAVCAQEQSLTVQRGGLDAQLALLQQEQARDTAQIEAFLAQQETLRSRQADMAGTQRKQHVLDTMRTLLRRAGPYITRAVIRQVSNGAAQIFGELMQDYARQLAWNEEYGITLDVDGRERQFAQLSGGEQMSAALAVRLALLREMSNIDIAFFDEPTSNLDEARRDSLARQIIDVKGFRQLFVISHDDTFEQATHNLVRIQRENGQSVVVSMQ